MVFKYIKIIVRNINNICQLKKYTQLGHDKFKIIHYIKIMKEDNVHRMFVLMNSPTLLVFFLFILFIFIFCMEKEYGLFDSQMSVWICYIYIYRIKIVPQKY